MEPMSVAASWLLLTFAVGVAVGVGVGIVEFCKWLERRM